MNLVEKYSLCHQFLIKDKANIDLLINQSAAEQYSKLVLVNPGNIGINGNASENLKPLQDYLSYSMSVGVFADYHGDAQLIAAYIAIWLEKYQSQNLNVTGLEKDSESNIETVASTVASTVAPAVAPAVAPKDKISQVIVNPENENSIQDRLSLYEWGYFKFQFGDDPGPADRQIVISADNLQDVRSLVNKSLEMMAGGENESNPYQIIDFKVLFNVNPMRRKLRDEKIIIHYASGLGGDTFPYFDENGKKIYEQLALLLTETGPQNIVFPFFPFYASLHSRVAWGAYKIGKPFAETRSKALADMLGAVGEVSKDNAHFIQCLEQYFFQHDIDPNAPHLNL